MKFLSRLINIISLILIGVVLIKQFPDLVDTYRQQGKNLGVEVHRDLKTGTNLLFPLKDNSLVIFWASWCGPCKVEMARLKDSVESGKIPASKIFAVNPFETPQEILSFLKVSDYPFTFIDDKSLSKKLKIKRTPTKVFLEGSQISSMSLGMSLFGIWQAEIFL